MDTIVIVENEESKIWEIIEKVFVYNKQFKTLNIASDDVTAKKCVDTYGFDVMIIDSTCKDILDYMESNYSFKEEKVFIISEDSKDKEYSFKNKIISINDLDKELEALFK